MNWTQTSRFVNITRNALARPGLQTGSGSDPRAAFSEFEPTCPSLEKPQRAHRLPADGERMACIASARVGRA